MKTIIKNWNQTINELLSNILQNSNYFNNIENNLFQSIILWYMNAGYTQFCAMEQPNIKNNNK